jgi:hypothetical protein
MKMTVFWDVASCRLVGNRPTFQKCLMHPSSGDDRPDDGGRKHI